MNIRHRPSPPSPRAPWPEGLDRTQPLQGRPWTRPQRAVRPPDVQWGWRALAALIAAAEIGLLGWLWFGPALSVHSIRVSGGRHMTPEQVTRAAGLSSGNSLLSIDGESAQQRLLAQVWVRTASVQPEFPGTVVIQISEWQPVAAYHAGTSSKLFLLSDQSVVLGAAASAGPLIVIQGPAGNDPRVGDRPLDPQLLVALVNMQKAMPSLIGQEVSGFVFDSCGDLTMVVKRGWRVYFGRVLTPEQFSGLRDKLASLKAIQGNGNVDYNSADLEYVNV
ncbi:MAG TPA: FtsQ-type POTRA domain-containing protein, partial [Candidatus Dormibacteraeota bacterium]|nr:FtsQ-type POTRA domain-containing protein [Candidatus Dormibacteraeota bacterium]